ncbi:MAG: AAA family ATPase [Acidaminobacter sp.]|uniref:ATP-binding protein n=1 Tax=Acidaminobacter sp. TaxID=1872102 RepID=UPI00137F3636|nr:AAA family ATPase [Acidaminobacter sp.]MZQ97929.1 AAA family ATPase [Acidaminobacter sp.]
MNLTELKLEGIGGYDQSKTFEFKPGLNLLVGPNEAGKSSLKRAAEIALVGFRSAQDRHMDSEQARVEARFSTESGSVRILRAYGKRMNGQRISEADSEAVSIGNGAAFDGMEPEVFASLFSIGVDELSELRTQDWETIESRLVGHLASTGMALPSEVLDQLSGEMSAIYRENGRGNFELKAILSALRTKREQRLAAVTAMEAEAGLDQQIAEIELRLEAAESEARLWQSRADQIHQRPDLLALVREVQWYDQKLEAQDDLILPDREAFEVYEKNRQRLEAVVEPENRAKKSAVGFLGAAAILLTATLGLSAVLRISYLAFAGIAAAFILIWRGLKDNRQASLLERQRREMERDEARFIQELPFQGSLAVEESLALLELREKEAILRTRLNADLDYARFSAWLPNQPLEEAQSFAMNARLELAALENRRLALELKSRRQEIAAEIEDVEREILGLERRQSQCVSEWNRLLLESLIVASADQAFRSRRRYDFLAESTVYLKKLTNERYTALLARAESPGRFMVEGPEGLKPVDGRLSRGTQEQVYLALKLGLADALDPEGNWPVFLDDVAVNFDRVRRSGFDALLETISKRRQVFYFTCRDDLPARLEANLIRMG